MASEYIIKNIEKPLIRYYLASGYQVYSDLCKFYMMEPMEFPEFLSKVNATYQDVQGFYKFLDKSNANPFNKTKGESK